jgi:hypothetical protein
MSGLHAILGSLLFWTIPLSAVTYYIASNGLDSNDGRSISSPWKTLAKVNAASLKPGDEVRFERGGVWQEELRPVTSGTSASPIIYDAYGTGPAPEIAAYDYLSRWAADAEETNWTTIWAAEAQTGAKSTSGGVAARQHREIIKGSQVTGSGTLIRVRFKQNSGAAGALSGVSICAESSSTSSCTTTPTALLQSKATAWTIPQGIGYIFSDPLTFKVAAGTSYLVNFAHSTSYSYNSWVGGAGEFWFNDKTDHTMTQTVAGFNTNAATVGVEDIESGRIGSAIPNVYQISLSYMPTNVFRGDKQLIQVAGHHDLSADGRWAYDGGVGILYIYSVTDPSNSIIRAQHRARAVQVSSVSYLNFNNLRMAGGTGFAVQTDAASHINFTNVDIALADGGGESIQNGSSFIRTTGGKIHDNGWSTVSCDCNGLDWGGLGDGSSNLMAIGVELYRNGGPNGHAQVEIATTLTNAVLSNLTLTNLLIHDGTGHGVQIGGGQTGVTLTGLKVWNNAGYGLFTNSGTSGSPAITVSESTFFANGFGKTNPCNLSINANSLIFKGNIVALAIGPEVCIAGDLDSPANVFNGNNYYHPAGTPYYFMIANTPLTLGEWKAATGQDATSTTNAVKSPLTREK